MPRMLPGTVPILFQKPKVDGKVLYGITQRISSLFLLTNGKRKTHFFQSPPTEKEVKEFKDSLKNIILTEQERGNTSFETVYLSTNHGAARVLSKIFNTYNTSYRIQIYFPKNND